MAHSLDPWFAWQLRQKVGRVSLVACLELPRNACSKRALCPLQGVTGYAWSYTPQRVGFRVQPIVACGRAVLATPRQHMFLCATAVPLSTALHPSCRYLVETHICSACFKLPARANRRRAGDQDEDPNSGGGGAAPLVAWRHRR